MDRSPEHDAPIPADWDRLDSDGPSDDAGSVITSEPAADEPVASPPPRSDLTDDGVDTLTLLAAGWAEVATLLAVCTACVASLLLVGGTPTLGLLPWAAGAAGAWWLLAATVLVTVRSGSPGMLLAGVVFVRPVRGRRVGGVVAAAALGGLSLGLLVAAGGPRKSLLATAAGSPLVSRDLGAAGREP